MIHLYLLKEILFHTSLKHKNNKIFPLASNEIDKPDEYRVSNNQEKNKMNSQQGIICSQEIDLLIKILNKILKIYLFTFVDVCDAYDTDLMNSFSDKSNSNNNSEESSSIKTTILDVISSRKSNLSRDISLAKKKDDVPLRQITKGKIRIYFFRICCQNSIRVVTKLLNKTGVLIIISNLIKLQKCKIVVLIVLNLIFR